MQELFAIIIILIVIIYLLFQDSIEYFDTNTLTGTLTKATNNANPMTAISIAKGASYPGVWGISKGNLYFSPLTNTAGKDSPIWTQITGPTGKTLTSVVANDKAIVVTASDNTTWYSSQPCNSTTCNWSQISKNMLNNMIDMNTNQLWAVDHGQNLWVTQLPCTPIPKATTVDCNWLKVNDNANTIAVNDQYAWKTVNANNVSTISQATISNCTSTAGNTKCNWQANKTIQGKMIPVSVDPVIANNDVWATDGNLIYNSKADASGSWNQLTSPDKTTMTGVSTNGQYVWAIDNNGNVYAQTNTAIPVPTSSGLSGGATIALIIILILFGSALLSIWAPSRTNSS